MNASIKLEPDIIEDTISQADEFLDEKPDIQNDASISNTNTIDQLKEQIACKNPGVCKKKKNPNYKKTNSIKKHTKPVEFTFYLKKQFLNKFKLEGWSPQTILKYANTYNLKVEEVNAYFDQTAKEAQHFVYQECDSLSFSNITEWLEYFQAKGFSEHCNYEPAIVMNAIANNEYHPDPSSMEGINLKEIYKFLSNALMGLPQKPLDEASAKFLSNEFQNLINEANTDEADNDVRNMKRKIENSRKQTVNRKSNNLDPLNTYTKELEKCYLTNFNPNIKYENIVMAFKNNKNNFEK